MAMSPRDQVRRLDVPKCGCPDNFIPRCQFDGWDKPKKTGCRERAFNAWLAARRVDRAGRVITDPKAFDLALDLVDCDCAWLPGKPCGHVTGELPVLVKEGGEEKWFYYIRQFAGFGGPVTWDDFVDLLDLHFPQPDPPPPPRGCVSILRIQRVDTLAMRRRHGVALWSDKDSMADVGKRAKRLANGQDSKDEEIVFEHEADYEWAA